MIDKIILMIIIYSIISYIYGLIFLIDNDKDSMIRKVYTVGDIVYYILTLPTLITFSLAYFVILILSFIYNKFVSKILNIRIRK